MPKKSKNFSEDNLSAAIQAANDGMTKKAAARQFGVARTTLIFRLKNPEQKTTCGPSSVLSKDEEYMLVKWILECSKKGFPRRKEDLQLSVKKFLELEERPNPFKNNFPGTGWYRSFLRRNPIITSRTSEHVTSASANVSESNIRKWFKDIHQYLMDENLAHILNDPKRVFNGDETGFSLCPKTKTVLAAKGSKDVYEVATGNAKENITVMFTFNAAGNMCPPMVIYNFKRIPKNIIDSVPPNWGIGHSDTGWMKAEVFYEFVANIFYPYIVDNNIELPVILFVDGHKSHLTYNLSELCTKLKIILIALYPNATRILQPADVAAFRPLKSGWKNGACEWRNENPNSVVTRKDFAPILDRVIKDSVKSETLKNGFKACGLYPWNVDEIDFRKCLGKPQTDYQTTETEIFDTVYPNTYTLNYEEFTEIVGVETIEKLNEIKDDVVNENHSKKLQILYRIHESLKNNLSENQGDDNFITLTKKISPHELNTSIEQEEKQKKLSEGPLNTNQTSIAYKEPIPSSNIDLDNNYSSAVSKGNVCNDEQIIIKKLNVSPLESCLVWPNTPERKGNRTTERVPFVVSSKMWKDLYTEKENRKRCVEDEKELKKQIRIQNKIKKNISVPTKKLTNTYMKKNIVRNLFSPVTKKRPSATVTIDTPKSPIFIENQIDEDTIMIVQDEDSQVISKLYTGFCVYCNQNLDDIYFGYECNFCSDQYHQKCLKKNEYCDIGLDSTILFICDKCETNVFA